MAPRKPLRQQAVADRAQHFLKALVERYIREGQPVGSRTLAKDAGLDLSPATVRNVMSDLEEMGFVVSPHTSAGRVPTVSGYRMFVDTLITLKHLTDAEVESFRERLDPQTESSDLIAMASQLLSGVTQLAGVVMLPRRERNLFRQIEFLPLSGDRVLAILVTNEEEVDNRIIHTRRVYSTAELEQAANYLNELFAGKTLERVRDRLLREMTETRQRMDKIMERAIEMGGKVFDGGDNRDDCMIAGQTNLLEVDDLASMEQLKRLFDAFLEKNEILHLLDQCMEAEGVQIFIGEESGYQLLDECSVITAPYKVSDEAVGVLGVIGPTRMAYQRIIPIVDITARLLGAALNQR